MKNPYNILNLRQDANNAEIVRAMAPALRARKYSQREITEAQTTLRKPASRLAADFTLPILDCGRVQPLTTVIRSEPLDFGSINENKYNSLNEM